jgi:hypothetical protein
VQVKLNLECAIVPAMVDIACRVKPDQVTLVPEKREEVTTEGGLDVVATRPTTAEAVRRLRDAGITVSLFIDPNAHQIDAAVDLAVEAVELHTGCYANETTDAGRHGRLVELSRAGAMARQAGLALNAGVRNGTVTKTGSGVLFIGGVSGTTAAATITAGTLNLGNSGILGGRLTLDAGTTLEMRGDTYTIGSLVGSGVITNNSTYSTANTAGTLIVGYDNTSTAFDGMLANFENNLPGTLTGMPLNLTKIGNGTLTLTADSAANNTGTLAVNAGTFTLGPAGRVSFNAYTLQRSGLLTLDNSATAVSNRLGGATLTGGTTARGNFTFNGGTLAIVGNAATAVSEAIGPVANSSGGSVITLDAAGTAGVSLSVGNWSGQGGQNTMLIRGTGLGGGAAGAGRALVTPTGTFVYTGTQGGGADSGGS